MQTSSRLIYEIYFNNDQFLLLYTKYRILLKFWECNNKLNKNLNNAIDAKSFKLFDHHQLNQI